MNATEKRLEAERTIKLGRYRDDGFESRVDYLRSLAEDHDLELSDILEIVDILGPGEDFDGLIVFLEDHAHSVRASRG